MTDHDPTADAVISFDLDGTLISGPFGRVISDLHETLAEQGFPDSREAVLKRHQELLVSDPLAAYDWDSLAAEYLAERGADKPFDLVDRLAERIEQSGTRLLLDRTFESLAALRSAGWRVAVLTNGWRRYQEPLLRSSGLLAAVDQLVTADDVGEPKPAAATFAAVRGTARRYLLVGDRLDHDVMGGNQVQARTVLLRDDVPVHGVVRRDAQGVPSEKLRSYLEQLATEQRLPVTTWSESITPDLCAASLTELVSWLT